MTPSTIPSSDPSTSSVADTFLHRLGITDARNRRGIMRWWRRFEAATGQPPDVAAHVRQVRTGLCWPIQRWPESRRLLTRSYGVPRP